MTWLITVWVIQFFKQIVYKEYLILLMKQKNHSEHADFLLVPHKEVPETVINGRE